MNPRAFCRGIAAKNRSNPCAKIREAMNPSHMNQGRLALTLTILLVSSGGRRSDESQRIFTGNAARPHCLAGRRTVFLLLL